MNIAKTIFPLVSAAIDARTYLGNGPVRFYEFGTAPQGDNGNTYATWQVITGTPDNLLDRRPDVDFVTVQIDVWASTTGHARAAASAIRDALEDEADITGWRTGDQDAETGMHRFMLNASFILDN